MANSKKLQDGKKRPALRALGLDPEITAQPRPIPDELALEASAEPDLSVDADELGSRFLREAIEQGDFDPERGWPADASLSEGPARDQPLGGTNFVAGNKVWEQTIDLVSRTQGAADALREAAPPAAADFDEALEEDDLEQDTFDARAEELSRVTDSSVRELSLFDRPSGEGDETVAPDLQLDEQGSHTRMAARPAAARPHPKSTAMPEAAPRVQPHLRVLQRGLGLCARWLRALASRLQQS